MEQKKILIGVDKERLRWLSSSAEFTAEIFNKLSTLYAPLNLGYLDMPTFLDTRSDAANGKVIKALLKRAKEAAETDVINAKSDKEIYDVYSNTKFYREAIHLKNTIGYNELEAANFLTVTNGVAEFTESDKERLKEYCSSYISSEKEIKAYQLHMDIIKLLNEITKDGTLPVSLFSIFEREANGKYKAKPLNYAAFAEQIYK